MVEASCDVGLTTDRSVWCGVKVFVCGRWAGGRGGEGIG